MAGFLSVAGVPISTQWGPQGYYYPIQIAQYALSHYSKHLKKNKRSGAAVVGDTDTTDVDSPFLVLEDVENDDVNERWTISGSGSLKAVFHKNANSHVVEFLTSGWQFYMLTILYCLREDFFCTCFVHMYQFSLCIASSYIDSITWNFFFK